MRKQLVFAIFLGSFMSFALEPMIGRTLLPVFGGKSARDGKRQGGEEREEFFHRL